MTGNKGGKQALILCHRLISIAITLTARFRADRQTGGLGESSCKSVGPVSNPGFPPTLSEWPFSVRMFLPIQCFQDLEFHTALDPACQCSKVSPMIHCVLRFSTDFTLCSTDPPAALYLCTKDRFRFRDEQFSSSYGISALCPPRLT